MKFLHAEQQIGNMVAEVEKFIQEKSYSKEELVLVCLPEHRSNCESMVEIDVETVDPQDVKDTDDHLLEKYDLDEADMDVYDNMIIRGGFILLAKKAAQPSHRDEPSTTFSESQSATDSDSHTKEIEQDPGRAKEPSQENITPPGFGVNFNDPQSDSETHEDVFNPEDPDPDNHRR